MLQIKKCWMPIEASNGKADAPPTGHSERHYRFDEKVVNDIKNFVYLS